MPLFTPLRLLSADVAHAPLAARSGPALLIAAVMSVIYGIAIAAGVNGSKPVSYCTPAVVFETECSQNGYNESAFYLL